MASVVMTCTDLSMVAHRTREIFTHFDKDRDGLLNFQELSALQVQKSSDIFTSKLIFARLVARNIRGWVDSSSMGG